MMAHKICFAEEIWIIIHKLSLLLLSWSPENTCSIAFLTGTGKGNICGYLCSIRVATVRGKYLENEIFFRSGKSQGILWMVREI